MRELQNDASIGYCSYGDFVTHLRSLSLSGFRGFAAESVLELGIPDGSRVGSGLTVLTGANNTGKSSILEALSLLGNTSKVVQLSGGRRNSNSYDHTTLRYEFEPVGKVQLQTERPGGNRMQWVWGEAKQGHGPAHPPVFVVPSSRLPSGLQVNESATSRYDYARSISEQLRTASNHSFASRLYKAHLAGERFSDVATEILGTPYRWTLDQHEANNAALQVRFPSPGQAPQGAESVGDGVSRALVLADAIYDSEPGEILVIDEPEMSLHPSAQRRLAARLAELAINRQVVLATHSPLFVEWSWLVSGARLGRTHLGQGSLVLSMLGNPTSRDLCVGYDGRSNGYLFGSEARESFFLEDGIVLVEGQDDAWSYRRAADQLNLGFGSRIHGWGVGGATRMPVFARAFSELGLKRVAAILDRGQEATAETLRSEFPNFKFLVSPATDVRSKQGGSKGLLDSTGRLESQFETEGRQLFADIESYLFPSSR